MTSDSETIPQKRGSSKTGAAHPGNLESRARAAASKAKTLAEDEKPLEHFPLAEPYPFETDWREAPNVAA